MKSIISKITSITMRNNYFDVFLILMNILIHEQIYNGCPSIVGFIILLNKPSKMSQEIKQDQLYEDLSTILILIKKIFKNMLLKNNNEQLNKSREVSNDETIISSRCTQLIIKYKKTTIKRVELANIISRFMCRVKEILKQITPCIPKEKIQITIVLKKMELISLKAISIDNSVSILSSLLEIIGSCNVKMIHSLKIKQIATQKEQKYNEKHVERQLSNKQKENQQKNKKTESKQNDLELMTKNMERYSVMGIDKEYFRGRYFDLKSQQSSTIFQEIFLRNKNIRSLINEYQKDYKKYTSKMGSNNSSMKSSRENLKKRTLCWQITPTQSQNSNLLSPKRQTSSRSSNSQRMVNNRSNQALTYSTMEQSAQLGIQTYRSMYESKMMRSRAKKTIKMTNTIIDVPTAVSNPNANMINTKRWNFFKKSQEHLKFRYKYSQNKSYNTTQLGYQYGEINPELFYTINK